MMEFVVQVFGGAGLIETIVELAYVVSSWQRFNAFEELLFLTNVAFEIGAELLFLCIGSCWLRRHSNLRTSVKTLTKDPVHHIAAVATDSADDISWELSALSLATIVLSLAPLLAWLTFLPVWGSPYGGADDRGVRVALSVMSLVGVGGFVVSIGRARVASSGLDKQRAMDVVVAVGMVLYAMQKSFEVFVLLSNVERLCPGVIGRALIAFLCFEECLQKSYTGTLKAADSARMTTPAHDHVDSAIITPPSLSASNDGPQTEQNNAHGNKDALGLANEMETCGRIPVRRREWPGQREASQDGSDVLSNNNNNIDHNYENSNPLVSASRQARRDGGDDLNNSSSDNNLNIDGNNNLLTSRQALRDGSEDDSEDGDEKVRNSNLRGSGDALARRQ
eukprot:g10266.t1